MSEACTRRFLHIVLEVPHFSSDILKVGYSQANACLFRNFPTRRVRQGEITRIHFTARPAQLAILLLGQGYIPTLMCIVEKEYFDVVGFGPLLVCELHSPFPVRNFRDFMNGFVEHLMVVIGQKCLDLLEKQLLATFLALDETYFVKLFTHRVHNGRYVVVTFLVCGAEVSILFWWSLGFFFFVFRGRVSSQIRHVFAASFTTRLC